MQIIKHGIKICKKANPIRKFVTGSLLCLLKRQNNDWYFQMFSNESSF